MDVELLVVPDCANELSAATQLRAALEDIGLPHTHVRATVINTRDDAEQRGFTGSPTILANGVDPFAQPGRPPALACRIYPTATGPAGVPPIRELRRALKRAAAECG